LPNVQLYTATHPDAELRKSGKRLTNHWWWLLDWWQYGYMPWNHDRKRLLLVQVLWWPNIPDNSLAVETQQKWFKLNE
jgi:hypothetical protein